MRKVVIAAEVFSPNLGDYAIYDSLSTLLLKRGIETIPLDISFRNGFQTEDVTDSHSIKAKWKSVIPKKMRENKYIRLAINRMKWQLIAKKHYNEYWKDLISNSDAVIIGGGQLLTDSSAKFARKLSLITNIANDLDKPICILGCGVGNNIGKTAKRNIRNIIASSSLICLRDANSVNKLKSIVGDNVTFDTCPDLAFALNPTTNRTTSRQDGSIGQEKVLGLNIMSLNVFKTYNSNLQDLNLDSYANFWKRIAIEANSKNIQVRIITNGSLQDYEQAQSVYELMLLDKIDVVLMDRPKVPLELYNQIHNVDMLVTTRMHAGIIGKAYGKLVSTLVWDDKIPCVWQEAGDKEVAINSDIILSSHPWAEINIAFEESTSISLDDLNKSISTSIDKLINTIY